MAMATHSICTPNAVSAVFKTRPEDIQRFFYHPDRAYQFGALTGYLAGRRKPYRMVDDVQLEKIAGTVHHGGVVAVVREKKVARPRVIDLAAWVRGRLTTVILDGIGNAHNLGAIVRTAAYFGVQHVVLADDPRQAFPSDAAYRVAEGGFEFLTCWRHPDLPSLLADLRPCSVVVGADIRGEPLTTLDRATLLGPPSKPIAPGDTDVRALTLVLGNEERGLSREVAAACHRVFCVKGRGKMESINVSAAAAIFLAAASIAPAAPELRKPRK
jgi:TrmH RNA methyltransferase